MHPLRAKPYAWNFTLNLFINLGLHHNYDYNYRSTLSRCSCLLYHTLYLSTVIRVMYMYSYDRYDHIGPAHSEINDSPPASGYPASVLAALFTTLVPLALVSLDSGVSTVC